MEKNKYFSLTYKELIKEIPDLESKYDRKVNDDA